jgi:uncharacterized membrane protein YhfC
MLYVTYTLNVLLMLALPFALAAFLARRLGVRWGLFWVGAVTFIASQLVHQPLGILLTNLGLIRPATSGWPLVLYAIELGLLAGLCEELARYLVLRFWLKRDRSWNSALMFGAGHGGAETFIMGVMAAVAVINLFVLRNVDPARLGLTGDRLIAAQAQVASAFSVPVLYPLREAYSRVMALAAHMFLAVLVMQVFQRRNILWLVAAILWHTLTDSLTVYVQTLYAGTPYAVILTEAIITLLAIIGLIWMFRLRLPELLPVAAATPPAQPPRPASDDQPDQPKHQ